MLLYGQKILIHKKVITALFEHRWQKCIELKEVYIAELMYII